MFIEGKNYKILRDAAKNGDEKAKKILAMQYSGKDEGFNDLISEYFAPNKPVEEFSATGRENIQEEPKISKLEQFLIDNDVHEGDPDYEEVVKMYHQENPEEECSEQCEKIDVLGKMDEMGTEEKNVLIGKLAVSGDGECLIPNVIEGLIKDEAEAYNGYSNAISIVVASKDCREMRSVLEEIANDELRHIEMLKRLLKK